MTKQNLRKLILQEARKIILEEKRKSEMREFSQSRSGKKVMKAGTQIRRVAGSIREISEDQTGDMGRTLSNISEFVGKLGSTLENLGILNENESVVDGLPTISELKQLQKDIQKLER